MRKVLFILGLSLFLAAYPALAQNSPTGERKPPTDRPEVKREKSDRKTDLGEKKPDSVSKEKRGDKEMRNVTSTPRLEEKNRETLRQKQEELRKEFQKKREEFQTNVQQRREELQDKIKEKRDELKQKLEKIKDERKKKVVERVDQQLDELNKRVVNHLSEVLDKLANVLERASRRADEFAGKADVTEATAKIKLAKTAIASARTLLQTQAGRTYIIVVDEESTLKTDVGKARRALEADLKVVREAVKKAHEAVRTAATTLAKFPRLEKEKNNTTTPE